MHFHIYLKVFENEKNWYNTPFSTIIIAKSNKFEERVIKK